MPLQLSPTRRHARPDLVMVAGAGPSGLMVALELIDSLPSLGCPALFSLRGVDATPLSDRIDGDLVQAVRASASIVDSPIWIAPSDRNTTVRGGRFELGAPGDASVGDLPSLGMLYHSVRTEFGSRVFVVASDPERAETPLLRLLDQRGAHVVTTVGVAKSESPDMWDVSRIVDYLQTHVPAPASAVERVLA